MMVDQRPSNTCDSNGTQLVTLGVLQPGKLWFSRVVHDTTLFTHSE